MLIFESLAIFNILSSFLFLIKRKERIEINMKIKNQYKAKSFGAYIIVATAILSLGLGAGLGVGLGVGLSNSGSGEENTSSEITLSQATIIIYNYLEAGKTLYTNEYAYVKDSGDIQDGFFLKSFNFTLYNNKYYCNLSEDENYTYQYGKIWVIAYQYLYGGSRYFSFIIKEKQVETINNIP